MKKRAVNAIEFIFLSIICFGVLGSFPLSSQTIPLYLCESGKILNTTAETGGTSYTAAFSSGYEVWTGTNIISGDISGTSYEFHIYAASYGSTDFRTDLKINGSIVATQSFTVASTTYLPYGSVVTGTDPSLSGTSTVTLEIHHMGGSMGVIRWGDFGSDDSYVVLPDFIQTLEVTSPNGGEDWEVGSSHDITWTSTGTSGNVHIEYSTNNGSNWTDVIASTTDDGIHPWTIPNAPSGNCLVRISDTDGNPSDQSDAVFTITESSLVADSLALIELYDSTDGDNWTNNTNWKTGPIPTWYGITVTNARVTKVELGGNNLVGTIPSSIGNLDSLHTLNLVWNQLTGTIPIGIGNLKKLKNLYFTHNQLSGQIPTDIGNLESIEIIDMSLNQLTGPVPDEICNLTNLRILFLNANQITGSIPTSIGNLINIEILHLDYNQLTDSIPSSIGNLANLYYLDLDNNQLSESIPNSIGNLMSLDYLNLGENELTGSIPSEIGNLTNLRCLYLYSNQLSGSFPTTIGNLTHLIELAFNENKLTGSVTPEIDNLTNLTQFYLHNNDLIDLPSLSAMSSLEYLNIQNNKFTFEDIETNIGVPSNTFTYSPQDSVGQEQDTTINQGLSLTISVSVGGDHNQYQWKKDGTIISGATDSAYTIDPVSSSDIGSYICEITNTVATELTVYSRPINVTVSADIIPPAVPQNLIATPGDQQVILNWNPNSEPDLHKYNIYRDTSSPASTLIDSVVAASPSDTFYVDIGLTNGQEYFYRITAVDNSNNESGFSNEISETPDTQPPQIVSVSPVQNALDVSKSTDISVTFDQDMNASTINENTFIIRASQTGLHTGTYSYNSGIKTATFNPDDNFVVGEIVTIILNTDIEKTTGDTLTNPYEWTFTVKVDGGDGRYYSKIEYTAGHYPSSVYASDFDSDNDMDLVVVNAGSDNVSVLLNNGDGTFSSKTDYTTGDNPKSVFSTDLDSNGDVDLAVANFSSNNVSVLFGNGDGTFQAKINYAAGDTPYSIFSSDVNSDGDMDLVVANYASINVSILINKGDGTFYAKIDYPVSGVPQSVYSSDLDSDGDMDLAVTNRTTHNISILLNNGDGTFGTKTDYTTGYSPCSVCASDLNSDGYMDLSVANDDYWRVSVLLNNGDGTFGARTDYATGANPRKVISSDLDADGDMDLAVVNFQSDNISVFRNNGNGTFSSKMNYITGSNPYSVFASDLDSDGDMDLAVANWSSDNVSVLFNGLTSPKNLTSTPDDQQITLRWSPNAEPDLHKYNIYRDTSSPVSTLVDSVVASSPPDTFYVDDGLTNGQEYFYRITAVDSSNNESVFSDEVSTTPGTLIAYYPFNGNANDESGSGNHGIPVNGPVLVADKHGNPDSAYRFDGSNDYITVPDNSIQRVRPPLSISFWFKVDNLSTKNTIFCKGDGLFRYYYCLTQTSGEITFGVEGYTENVVTSNTLVEPNRWYHIIGIHDGDNIAIYVNSQLDSSISTSNTSNPSHSVVLDIGIDPSRLGTTNYLDGVLDELRIYNRVLSTEEIDSLYDEFTPEAPQYLTGTAGDEQITLRWSPNSEPDVHKYNIYRNTFSPATTLIDSVVAASPPDTFYVDTGLTNGQEYFYRITAVDSSKNESEFSDEVSAITPEVYTDSETVNTPGTYSFNEGGDGHQVDIDFTGLTGSGDVTVEQCNAIPSNAPGVNVCDFKWDIDESGITSFSVDVTFNYTNSDVSGYTESEAYLGIAKFNASTNTWIWLGGTVNSGSNTITVPGITSFSTFALFRRIFGDCTGDGYVDAADLQRLGDCWHETNSGEFSTGIDARFFNTNKNTEAGDQIIDAADLQVFGDCWHNGVEP